MAAKRRFQAFGLFCLSLILLPFSVYLLTSAYVLRQLLDFRNFSLALARRSVQAPRPSRPVVLITGLHTTQSLFLARAFAKAGCRVIGADEVLSFRLLIPRWGPLVHLLPPAAVSIAIKKFYRLPSGGGDGPRDLLRRLEEITEKEHVSYWISCCGGSRARHEIAIATELRDRTGCMPIMLHGAAAKRLQDNDEALTWLGEELNMQVPLTHTVQSRDQAHRILSGRLGGQNGEKPSKPYLLRRISGTSHGGQANGVTEGQALERPIKLPKRTVSETYETLSRLPVNSKNPYVLTEDFVGKRYRTVALLVANGVRVFVAYELSGETAPESAGLKTLSPESAICVALLRYNQSFASSCKDPLTGHVTFEFAVMERATALGFSGILYATAVRPALAPAIALLAGRERELAQCYLEIGRKPEKGAVEPHAAAQADVLMPNEQIGLFWAGSDVVKIIEMLVGLLFWRIRIRKAVPRLEEFCQRLLSRSWVEATATVQDPLPAFWLYQIYWPTLLLANVWSRQRWSGIELSSGDWVK